MSETHALPPPATSRNSDEDSSHHTPVLSGASEPAIEWNDIEFKISTQNFGRTLLSRFNQRVRGKHDGDERPRSRELSHMSHSIANLNDVVAVDAPAGGGKDAPPPPKFRTLLHRTSGIMPKAKFIAIMGSSGAGKTTFLNTLSGQLKVSSIRAQKTGVVRVNGKRLTKQVFQDHCAYVQQFDALTPLLTVEETVLFHANLRLPATMSWNEKRERANDVIRKLGLEHVRHSRIGDEYVRGISGGERRRVSIAIEMVSGPEVLFLDEPTSGLDAKTSLNLATTLSELAHEHNLTVVCTIHQPRSQIFEKFDCLMLLARGHIVYYGEANRAIDHFTSLGFPCPTHENPADFFIDLLTLDSNSEESAAQSNERVEQIIAASKINAGSMVARGEAEEERKRRLTLNRQSQAQLDRPRGFLSRRSSRGAFWFMQVLWLWLRATLCIVRNPAAAFSRFAPVVSGLVIALLWMQMDSDQTTISDRQSLLFLSVVSVNFPEAFANLVLYPMERAIYQRERENRVYSASAYWVATQLAHLPLQILAPLPFLILVYWVSGLQTGFQHFVVYVVTVELTSFCANSVGLFMGAAMPAQLASIATPSAMVLLFLVGGFFLYPDNMPNWLYWTRYLSWFTYANDALVVNEFSGKAFYCKPDQFQVLSVNATCAGTMEVVSNTTSICPTTNGQSVIDFRSSDKLPIFGNVLILFGFVVLFRFLLYFPLRYAKPKA